MSINTLINKRVIVLRSAHQADELLTKIRDLGGQAIHCPMLEMRPTLALESVTPLGISLFSMVIFASTNAVDFFEKALLNHQISLKDALSAKKIIAVGEKTAAALAQKNVSVALVPEHFSQEGILAALELDLSTEHILLPNANNSNKTLEIELKNRRAQVITWAIYESHCPELQNIEIKDSDFVIFTSSMMATFFFQSPLFKNQKIIAICIGKNTQQTVMRFFTEDIVVAKQASVAGLIQAMIDFG